MDWEHDSILSHGSVSRGVPLGNGPRVFPRPSLHLGRDCLEHAFLRISLSGSIYRLKNDIRQFYSQLAMLKFNLFLLLHFSSLTEELGNAYALFHEPLLNVF